MHATTPWPDALTGELLDLIAFGGRIEEHLGQPDRTLPGSMSTLAQAMSPGGQEKGRVMRADEILHAVESLASGDVRESMKRFGINIGNARGVKTPALKALARKIGRDHAVAAQLWKSGIFEARAVAAMVDEPDKVTRLQMEHWTQDFDSWAICDACCCYLYRKTPFAWEQAVAWAARKPEFVKRAGFSLMAYLAVHDKAAADRAFQELFPVIEREADDERPFVKKAVNWALRQIGKRNLRLNRLAIRSALAMRARGARSARWIGADALRELRGEAVQRRLLAKEDSPRRAPRTRR